MAVLFLLVVAFFAVTRTQVGRDELGNRIEAGFASSYRGSLSIGKLTGNVLANLYASDIVIRDENGTEVVRIDSVVVRPKWGPLLRKSFSVHEISLYRPQIVITYDSLGNTSLEKAMIPRAVAEADSNRAWTFQSASIFVEDASVQTIDSSGSSDFRSDLDIRNALLERINIIAQIDWSSAEKQIDLLQMTAHLDRPELNLVSGISQILYQDGKVTLNRAELRTDRSRFSLSGFSDHLDPAYSWIDAGFQLDIEGSTVDFDEFSPFIPQSPLAGSAGLNAHIEGPVSDMTLSWLNLEKGESTVELSGTVAGYPDSLQMDLSIANTQVASDDVRQLLPGAGWAQDLRVDTVNFQMYASGTISGLNDETVYIDSRSTFDLNSDGGMISGSLSLDGSTLDSLAHSATIRIQNVDLYEWTNRARLQSSLSGVFQSNGFSMGPDSIYASMTADLSNLSLASHSAEAVDLDLSVSPDSLFGTARLTEGAGSLDVAWALILANERRLRTSISLVNADVGPVLGISELSSSINAQVSTYSSLQWNEGFSGDLSADVGLSRITIGDSTAVVPPHTMSGTVRPPSTDDPVFDFSSDMFEMRIESDGALPTMVALTQSWIASFRSAVDNELNKTLYADLGLDEVSATLVLNEMLAVDRAYQRMTQDQSSLRSTVEFNLLDADLLAQLSPTFPDLEGYANISADLVWSPDDLTARLDLSTPHLSLPGVQVDNLGGTVELGLNRISGLIETASVASKIDIDTLHAGGFVFANQDVLIDLTQGSGSFLASNSGTTSIDSLMISADLLTTEFTNSVVLREILMDTGTGSWILEEPATFSFYGDATSLDQASLRFIDDGLRTNQSLRASGVLSSAPSDSVVFAMNDLLLRPFSQFMNLRRTLGGQLNSEFVISGGRNLPRIAGAAEVLSLSLDEKLLGNVALSSDYISGSPDVEVDLSITPSDSSGIPRLFGTVLPAVWVENDLRIQGIIRLPGDDPGDRGALDLDMNVDRLDLFFFKYIFQEALGSVSGFATGSGRITGELLHPIFDMNMGILDGYFDIPLTQARYSLDGSVRIDEEAIHFDPLNLVDHTNGSAQLNGRLLFNNYTAFTLDMTGNLDELLIMNVDHSDELPFYGFLRASGDLNLTGPLFNASLTSSNAVTRADSELFIPIVEETTEADEAFIHYSDSLGYIPDFDKLAERPFFLARRPTAERQFLDGLNLDLNIFAPPGSTVHLVIDPLLGDVINAVSTGNVQLLLSNGEFQTFGQLEVTSGDYQFTAGELFIRTFLINEGGSIVWEGDPVNAKLDIPASYRTRASRTGLPGIEGERGGLIPLIVNLQIAGTVFSPEIGLSLSVDRTNQNVLGNYQAFEAQLNQPDRATEYATSVLILNSFQLTTENITTDSGGQLAFNSVSQLVSAQLNRFLNEALPNVDFSFGLQGENAQDLDVTYGVAMRFLNDRLIIRGEGVYQGNRTDNVRTNEGLQGEFVVEIRVGPRVSVEVFFRREGDILDTTELTNTAGVGVSYQTEFESWRSLIKRAVTKQGGSS